MPGTNLRSEESRQGALGVQTLGARIQMQRVSFEPGRLPEAGVGSRVVKERGSVAWPSGSSLGVIKIWDIP